MQKSYQNTIYACYIGYITQGVVNCFAPLLFLTFISYGWADLKTVTLLTTLNFGFQLFIDFLSAYFVDKIGYRTCIVAAHIFAAAGLIGLSVLPRVLPIPFLGLLISVILYAIGGGLLEVLVSPIVEACPSENKAAAMSILHSFYCWGVVAVIALSTLYMWAFGRDSWVSLAFIWAILPLANAVLFSRVPINSLTEDGEGMNLRELFKTKIFWIFALLMLAAGASEMAMSQWASAFAESGLKVSKAVGDLAGPCMFSILMGLARALYGKFGAKINLRTFITMSALLCLACYILTAVSPNPILSLIGCGLCGFSVGIMWPGVFSLAAEGLPRGGTALFAMLALAGDLGCTSAPTFVGFVSSAAGDNLRIGLALSVIFPIVLILGIFLQRKASKKNR